MRKRKADQERIRKILERRGYPGGKAPRGYEIHHIQPLAEGGTDSPKNIKVIKTTKHKQIHANRKKQGRI